MEYKTIRIDTSFRGSKDEELEDKLAKGWTIIDKTVMGDRYIYYVLELEEIPEKAYMEKRKG